MHARRTRVLVAAVLALGWFAASAVPAAADRPDQLRFSLGGVDGDIQGSVDDAVGLISRDHSDGLNLLGAVVICRAFDPQVSVEAALRNPDKVLDLPKKVQIEQGSNLSMSFFSMTNGSVQDVPVSSCRAKVTLLDKNQDGTVFDDETDQISFSLNCGKDLATELGLNQAQTDELVTRLGEKVKCSGKDSPSGVCFRGDTPVATATGLRPIRDIRVGDRVWSWDEARNRNVLRRVSRLYQKPARALRTLRIGEETLYTTDEHPYWVDGRGWTRAADLAAGDLVRTQEGRRLTLLANTRVSDEQFYAGYTERPGIRPVAFGGTDQNRVYNLEVEDTHTFYVGAQRVLVHNK